MLDLRVVVSTALLATVLAAPAVGETEDRRLGAQVQLRGLQLGNFFEAPDAAPKENVQAVEAQARLTYRLHPRRPLETYATVSHTSFEQLGPSTGLGLGLRLDGRPHGFDVLLDYRDDRPSSDVGDEVGLADLLRLQGEYSWRPSQSWQVSGHANLHRVEYSLTPTRDHDFVSAGAFLRYRGFGYGFHPEVGAMWGQRSVEDPAEDHDQRDLFLQVRSAPSPSVYLSLRFRYRTRDYSIDDPLARNFERRDTRRQWVLTTVYQSHEYLGWLLYAAHEEADSVVPSRIFDTYLLLFGVTVDL